ncbi:S-methyl-5-thioribose-1-phosphate isomerase [Aliifodinibius salipaludis]|uniref:Methylthioribose-1-phosphate isomerase n=1 Tax=Fodinibius salipaludis TaxID=2032627 RepID=A0A2A2G9F9_9BACT|nr:S-methyl-5-thioribose-1-phosphate isomerase [Aliifodinibius salipaludis]PAU93644.1 S-methyl-5-thioribose-1-phosphate isomerase [Aliifodinibius salipaludis]
MSNNIDTAIQSIEWREDHVRILDQTYLPRREVYSEIRDVGRMWEAIKKLRIRGAPAIGIAAAYGLYLGIKDLPENSFESFIVEVDRIAEYLEGARPTAVNLKWATDRIKSTIHAHKDKDISEIKEIVLQTAKTIHDEDKRTCKKIGENGVELIPKEAQVLTHCNTGSLATGQYGTALSVILHAYEQGKKTFVWVDETRPLLQGSRLTAWELMNAEVPMKIITDSSAGLLMRRGEVDLVIVGADRIAANGDFANKIGTYPLAVLARENEIPFYVAAPLSTIDMEIETGNEIPLEEREQDEVLNYSDAQIAPKKAEAYNPAFDITPNKYISGIVTEEGIIEPPFEKSFKNIFED